MAPELYLFTKIKAATLEKFLHAYYTSIRPKKVVLHLSLLFPFAYKFFKNIIDYIKFELL